MFKPETPAVTSEATAELLPGYARYRALAANVPEKFRKELKVGYHHHATSAGIAPSMRRFGNCVAASWLVADCDGSPCHMSFYTLACSLRQSFTVYENAELLARLNLQGDTPRPEAIRRLVCTLLDEACSPDAGGPDMATWLRTRMLTVEVQPMQGQAGTWIVVLSLQTAVLMAWAIALDKLRRTHPMNRPSPEELYAAVLLAVMEYKCKDAGLPLDQRPWHLAGNDLNRFYQRLWLATCKEGALALECYEELQRQAEATPCAWAVARVKEKVQRAGSASTQALLQVLAALCSGVELGELALAENAQHRALGRRWSIKRLVGDHLFSVELDRTFIYRDSDEIGLSVAVSHVEAASGDKLAFLLGEGTTPEEVKARDAEAAELVQQITRGRMTLVHTSRSSAAGPGIYTTTYTLQGEPLLLARCDDEDEPAVEEDCEENPNGDLEEA